MIAKQISIFVENRAGRLSSIISLLSEEKINIRALSLADTSDFGILRLIVDDTEKAQKSLKDSGSAISVTDVIAVELDDRPGGLSEALTVLSKEGIEVEYAYAFLSEKSGKASVILRVGDNEGAEKLLKSAGFADGGF